MLDPLAEYPRWFVVTCAVLLAAAALWLLFKLLKLALWLAVIGVLLAGGAALVWLALR